MTMITPSYLGETIEYSSLHACRSTLEDPTKIKVTGRKLTGKLYYKHTGYMGHERFPPLGKVLAKHPERVIENAVYGMLPKTALGRQVLRRKLRVFAGAEHDHVAQQPKPLTFNKKGA